MCSLLIGGETMPNDFELLSKCFSYDPETGILRWKINKGKGHIGMEAGFPAGGPDPTGEKYIYVRVDGRNYRANRVAWILMTGEFPPKGMRVDHENGCIADNRWTNLRLATQSQNGMNRRIGRNNTSGVHGVGFAKNYGKWRARIMVDRKHILIGHFDSIEEAAAARKAAEEQYFGEFARKAT